jgi:hypothetical protein
MNQDVRGRENTVKVSLIGWQWVNSVVELTALMSGARGERKGTSLWL